MVALAELCRRDLFGRGLEVGHQAGLRLTQRRFIIFCDTSAHVSSSSLSFLPPCPLLPNETVATGSFCDAKLFASSVRFVKDSRFYLVTSRLLFLSLPLTFVTCNRESCVC